MRPFFFTLITLAAFATPGIVLSQSGDVCCVKARVSGDGATTSAVAESKATCTPGSVIDGQKICSAIADSQNFCSEMSEKQRCTTCGYFWNGTSCFVEDPVVKAKREIEAEKKKSEK